MKALQIVGIIIIIAVMIGVMRSQFLEMVERYNKRKL